MLYPIAKRVFDFTVALVGLIVLSPFIVSISFVTLLVIGRPIFFIQPRAGLHGKTFRLIKFRTMTHTRDSKGKLLPDAQRLTSFGRFLRKASLDELPQLINVLIGNLSLVGPRPLLLQYLERYTPQQARRHSVPQGITGWAQVNGRNTLSWEAKFERDIWYVDHRSFWLDLKILFLTGWKVLRREGITAQNEATMPEFMGTDKDTSKNSEEKNTTPDSRSKG